MAKSKILKVVGKAPHVADIENAVETEFNLIADAWAIIRKQMKKPIALKAVGWVPDNYGDVGNIKILEAAVRKVAGPGKRHSVNTLQTVLGPAMYHDTLAVMDSAMDQDMAGPPAAHMELRSIAHVLLHATIRHKGLGKRKIVITGGIAYDGHRAPIENRARGFRKRMLQNTIRAYAGWRLATLPELAWVLMVVAEEVKDIWQQVRLTAAYKKGALSMVNIADYDD
jgi:hypothetical protein